MLKIKIKRVDFQQKLLCFIDLLPKNLMVTVKLVKSINGALLGVFIVPKNSERLSP